MDNLFGRRATWKVSKNEWQHRLVELIAAESRHQMQPDTAETLGDRRVSYDNAQGLRLQFVSRKILMYVTINGSPLQQPKKEFR